MHCKGHQQGIVQGPVGERGEGGSVQGPRPAPPGSRAAGCGERRNSFRAQGQSTLSTETPSHNPFSKAGRGREGQGVRSRGNLGQTEGPGSMCGHAHAYTRTRLDHTPVHTCQPRDTPHAACSHVHIRVGCMCLHTTLCTLLSNITPKPPQTQVPDQSQQRVAVLGSGGWQGVKEAQDELATGRQ